MADLQMKKSDLVGTTELQLTNSCTSARTKRHAPLNRGGCALLTKHTAGSLETWLVGLFLVFGLRGRLHARGGGKTKYRERQETPR